MVRIGGMLQDYQVINGPFTDKMQRASVLCVTNLHIYLEETLTNCKH